MVSSSLPYTLPYTFPSNRHFPYIRPIVQPLRSFRPLCSGLTPRAQRRFTLRAAPTHPPSSSFPPPLLSRFSEPTRHACKRRIYRVDRHGVQRVEVLSCHALPRVVPVRYQKTPLHREARLTRAGLRPRNRTRCYRTPRRCGHRSIMAKRTLVQTKR